MKATEEEGHRGNVINADSSHTLRDLLSTQPYTLHVQMTDDELWGCSPPAANDGQRQAIPAHLHGT